MPHADAFQHLEAQPLGALEFADHGRDPIVHKSFLFLHSAFSWEHEIWILPACSTHLTAESLSRNGDFWNLFLLAVGIWNLKADSEQVLDVRTLQAEFEK